MAKGQPVSVGTLSLMPADNVRGMRADTLALLKKLDGTMYRWPGGNFVSGYDWRDGIGPRDRRPPRRNPAWTGVEHNDFGIDEFLDFCREIGTEPVIAVNTGLGDAYSAAQEVEYANGAAEHHRRLLASQERPRRTVRGQVLVRRQRNVGSLAARLHATEALHVQAQPGGRRHVEGRSFARADRQRPARVPKPEARPGREARAGRKRLLAECGDHMDLISEHFYRDKKPDLAEHVKQLADRDPPESRRRA